ncbi:MAG: hypothetical protein K1V90_06335 [Muribaculaceae bacterium]
MKKILISLFAAASMAFAYAAETLDYTLLVQLKDGNNVEFLFSSTPVATFEEGEMTITCNGGTNSEKFIISNVERMTVESSLSGITQIDTKGATPSFGILNGKLIASSLGAMSDLNIYSVDGTLIASARCDADGRTEIAIDRLTKGTYIASTGKYSFKFTK